MYLGSFNSLLIFAHCSHDITVIKNIENLITSKCNKQKDQYFANMNGIKNTKRKQIRE